MRHSHSSGPTRRTTIWLMVLAAVALIIFAVVAGLYLGSGAGQGSPVKQDAASGVAEGAAPDLGASAQMSRITGKAPLGGSSSSQPPVGSGEPGAIVAPGGVELQRPDPAAVAVPARPAASDAAFAVPDGAASEAMVPMQPASAGLPAEAAASR